MRLVLFLSLLAVGCAAGRPAGDDAPDASATLTGRVTYPQRIALPPDAILTVRLEDTVRGQAAAEPLAEQTTPTAGRQVPIPFVLSYPPDSIQAGRPYFVRAEIRSDDGTLLWLSEGEHPVLTQGAPSGDVEVRMVQVAREQTETGLEVGVVGPTLAGTAWRLVEITTAAGDAVRPAVDRPFTLAFDGDGRYRGQADCNRYGGSYEHDADGALRLSQSLSTLAACLDPAPSDAFLGALADAETAVVVGDRLRIQAGPRVVVLQRDGASD